MNGDESNRCEAVAAARLARTLLFLKRKWWMPVVVMLLAASLQAAYLLIKPEHYTGVARMWVGGKVRLPESSFFSEEWQNFFGTQIELMQGEKIRRRALAQVQRLSTNSLATPLRVEVSQPRKTTVFSLIARHEDPIFLEAYLNGVMDEYLKYKREVRSSSSDDTVASLAEQLEKVEREIQVEQERLANFQRTNNITVLQQTSVSAGNQLYKLNLQLADLKLEAELLSLVSPDESLEKNGDLRAPPSETSDEALSGETEPSIAYLTARQRRDLKKIEQKEMAENLRPKHPTMIKLAEEISRLDSLLEIYRQQSQEQLDSARERARLKIKAVEDSIRVWEPQVVEMNVRLGEHERNKMNLDRLQGMYNRLLQAKHNVDVNKSVDQESVSIMDRATVFPTPLRLPLKTSIAGLVGLIVGLGLVLLLEQLDQRLHTPAEVRLGIPTRLLGCVPKIRARRSEPRSCLLASDDRRHGFAESFRTLRACLQALHRNGPGPQTLLITSAVPGEGKSTIAANLAFVLAFSGNRVLLIDGDLRRGELHKLLSLRAAPGLSDCLQSTGEAAEFLQPAAATPNLVCMTRGNASSRAGELFAEKRFESLLTEVRKEFDFILIDGSPVLAAADSCTVAPKVDGTLFVLRAASTPRPLAQQAIALLEENNGSLLGTILNRTDVSVSEYPFYRYQGYGLPQTSVVKALPKTAAG